MTVSENGMCTYAFLVESIAACFSPLPSSDSKEKPGKKRRIRKNTESLTDSTTNRASAVSRGLRSKLQTEFTELEDSGDERDDDEDSWLDFDNDNDEHLERRDLREENYEIDNEDVDRGEDWFIHDDL